MDFNPENMFGKKRVPSPEKSGEKKSMEEIDKETLEKEKEMTDELYDKDKRGE